MSAQTINISVPKEYPAVLLLVGGGFSMLYFYTKHAYLTKRKEIYGRYKYMDNFKEDHKIAFGESKALHPHGDPDDVDGWYSSKLSYREWYELASAKRAHQDNAEAMPYATLLTLLGAIKFPWVAIGFSTVYLLGSLKLAIEYLRKGANTGGKCLGRAVAKYALYALAGVAVFSMAKLVRENNSLEKLTDLWNQIVKK